MAETSTAVTPASAGSQSGSPSAEGSNLLAEIAALSAQVDARLAEQEQLSAATARRQTDALASTLRHLGQLAERLRKLEGAAPRADGDKPAPAPQPKTVPEIEAYLTTLQAMRERAEKAGDRAKVAQIDKVLPGWLATLEKAKSAKPAPDKGSAPATAKSQQRPQKSIWF